jgi:hypothetical protein
MHSPHSKIKVLYVGRMKNNKMQVYSNHFQLLVKRYSFEILASLNFVIQIF